MIRYSIALFAIGALFTLGMVHPVSAQEVSPPKLKYVMTYQGDVDPGDPIAKDLVIFNVPGGWVKTASGGSGKVIAPCADWVKILPSGDFKMDVRCSVKMDDGSVISLDYSGLIKFTEASQAKFQKGELITSSDAYWITNPVMRTSSEKYAWVNDAMLVGKLISMQPPAEGAKAYVRYDLYQVVP